MDKSRIERYLNYIAVNIGNSYTNSKIYSSTTQITDISNFTKLYDTTIPFGNYGNKVSAALDLTNESTIESNMSGGWNGTGSCYYESENRIGAYFGYSFDEPISNLVKLKCFIGRFSGQNANLICTVEKLIGNTWTEVCDLTVTTQLPYPKNIFTVDLTPEEINGIRVIHKKDPQKSGGNNIVFFGMTLYRGSGELKDVYTLSKDSEGLINPPNGYSGFGPIYIK